MIAFCTAFDSRQQHDQIEWIELGQLSLTGEAETDDEKPIDDYRPQHLLEHRRKLEKYVVEISQRRDEPVEVLRKSVQ
jgi:hypothetical protein